MKDNTFRILMVLVWLLLSTSSVVHAQVKHGKTSRFTSYKGLVMAGYQGWFNAKGDGGDRGWNHYGNVDKEQIRIELWPEISEYKKTYPTPFKFSDGNTASLFSSYDDSSVQLHFKWMQQYGIDGVFIQRFVSNLKYENGLRHNNKVFATALDAAEKNKPLIKERLSVSSMLFSFLWTNK